MKTMAIRLDEELHAQLSVLAQLEEVSVTEFIRTAIEAQIELKRSNPDLAAKAESALADIDAEAQNRRSAIATMFGDSEPPKKPAAGGRSRKSGDDT
jgi:predicted transcriptional regulator